jgi:Uncharacterized protein conserved in bacteria (DUF2330)
MMTIRLGLAMSMAIVLLDSTPAFERASACCPAPPNNKPVVNADQTVIMIWDAKAKTQHFIRQASFKSAAEDFGFLIPSPTQPELGETGQEPFTLLAKLTEPEKIEMKRPAQGVSCGCADSAPAAKNASTVRVLEEKLVAGYHAVVLEASTANALVDWLKNNGYAYSPEVQAWAEPYVKSGWKFTALKVAKDKGEESSSTVNAKALRMTFQTDRPLFPYREPKSTEAAKAVGATSRLLRIYFIAEARYQGQYSDGTPWNADVAWANSLSAENRKRLLETLKLPENTGPAEWHLTEFEHHWPYEDAHGDVYFQPDPNQTPVKREPWIIYVGSAGPGDIAAGGLAAVLVVPFLMRRLKRRSGPACFRSSLFWQRQRPSPRF